MQTAKECERCHEEKPIVLFRGRSAFVMPWCKECRLLDPVGAKRINDRLRRAMLDEKKLKEKNEKRAQRAREIRAEVRAAENTACDLALAALEGIDLSEYAGREKRAIESELQRISAVVRLMKH